jgi:outer membrane receptor for ferrienterochelin and colicin
MKGRDKKALTLLLSALSVSFIYAQKIDSANQIKEVEIVRKQAPRMEMATQNVELISGSDLKKDACCNLSESFMRSGAVDVQYSDGVSGAKEIRMLGLAGNYLQTMYENVPGIRGINSAFGMEYLPGTWMQSIQINKGAGSVVNGYDAITGQMNVELKKPQSAEKFFLNVYLNQDARAEINSHFSFKLKDKDWYTMGLVHGSVNWLKMDFNKDGFIDNPLFNRFTAMNRWFHVKSDGGMLMIAGSVNFEDRKAGQLSYDFKKPMNEQQQWGSLLKTNHAELFAKTSFLFEHESTLGIQYKYSYQQQSGFIGRKELLSLEHFGYVNAIYQNEFSEGNTIKVGASFFVNDVRERLDTFAFKRTELVPGVFAEATFSPFKKMTIVAGLRVDQHNIFGTFLSPRLNIKWDILPDLSLRVSGGRGYRTPNLIADNYSYFFSNRNLSIDPLKPEIAWNYGASLSYKFNLDFREGWVHLDFYRTDFAQQLVVDLEQRNQLQIYTQNGKLFSNSLQAEVSYEVVENVTAKIAYKWDNVKVNYREGFRVQSLKPQHKILFVLDYDWKKPRIVLTTNFAWYSKVRVPAIAIDEKIVSKYLYQWNMQITKKIKEQWEVYLGAENILNQTQPNPIQSALEPLHQNYDATLIWGPVRGAMVYAGFRFVIK